MMPSLKWQDRPDTSDVASLGAVSMWISLQRKGIHAIDVRQIS